jgi:hypothetical protein
MTWEAWTTASFADLGDTWRKSQLDITRGTVESRCIRKNITVMARGTRTPSDVFRSVMEKAKQRLQLESAEAGDFDHHGIRGDERAASLAKFFRDRLPKKFGVEKGEAIDFGDRRTGQIDFVIYDRARCAPIRVGNENLLLPCEALYCIGVHAQNEIILSINSALYG